MAEEKKPKAAKAPKAAASAAPAAGGAPAPRMKKHYEDVVREEMTKQFGYKNALQAPRIEKIVVNMGVGEVVNDSKKIEAAAKQLGLITGQKPLLIACLRLWPIWPNPDCVCCPSPERRSNTHGRRLAPTLACSGRYRSGCR